MSEKRIYKGLVRCTPQTLIQIKKIAADRGWTISQTLEEIVVAYKKK